METPNEKKAREIAQSVSFFWTNEDDCEKSIIDTVSLRKAIFNAALQAMQLKDEQHAKEKQQLIDKVCEWIKEYNGDYISIVPNDHLTNNFYDDLRKAMEGE